MKILFVHQNFPSQFKHLAPALAADPANEVRALTLNSKITSGWSGIRVHHYHLKRGTSKDMHPWVADIEPKAIRGEAAYRAASEMRDAGFSPDVIVAHPGWGESLFLKWVWPKARLGIYCEFFYHAEGADMGFDPEFRSLESDIACRMQLKNMNNLLHFEVADAGISPTHWQASTFPERFRQHIRVIHDGIDTEMLVPNPAVVADLHDKLRLTRDDEVITFVNRNLEPYRGYHIFMRALPELLSRRPNAQVLIVGGNDVSYGARPPSSNWKTIFIDEIWPKLDAQQRARVHFLGNLSYEQFIPLLQLSRVHVYLTYPFVLSWSLLEAMSIGCAIVASDTQPLHEAISHNETGRLVNFFDHHALVNEVVDLLASPEECGRLGQNARRFAQQNYDVKTVCLPAQLDWVRSLMRAN